MSNNAKLSVVCLTFAMLCGSVQAKAGDVSTLIREDSNRTGLVIWETTKPVRLEASPETHVPVPIVHSTQLQLKQWLYDLFGWASIQPK